MSTGILLIAWHVTLHGSPAVVLEDLDRFPQESVARGQRELCEQHLERLRRWRAVQGSTPRIERWERQTRDRLNYWLTLEQAHDNWGGPAGQLFGLRKLHDLAGRPAYLAGWSPELWNDPEP